MQPNLLEILKYQRGHGSVTEATFINHYLIPMINSMGHKPSMDEAGNIWVALGSDPYLFTAHIDTCHRTEGMQDPLVQGDIVSVNPKDFHEQGTNCLGADDGVGIYCNLRMIEAGIGGTYLFTRGEECGGIGATHAAKDPRLKNFILCVEVDRAGYDEVIVAQGGLDCASDTFGKALAKQLGMGHSPSDFGVYTDNYEFMDIIPENVNLAAGYISQHTVKETVDLAYVEKLVTRLLTVDWGLLPIDREPELLVYSNTGDTYRDLLAYCEDNPERAAHFLESLSVDVYEMDNEWNSYLDSAVSDEWDYDNEYSELKAGLF